MQTHHLDDTVGVIIATTTLQATELGIHVSNIPSRLTANALSCAEMAIYLMLSLARDLQEMANSIATHQLGTPCGRTLYGAHALVIGFGGLAQELVPRLAALGMHVSCVRADGGRWATEENAMMGDVDDGAARPDGNCAKAPFPLPGTSIWRIMSRCAVLEFFAVHIAITILKTLQMYLHHTAAYVLLGCYSTVVGLKT